MSDKVNLREFFRGDSWVKVNSRIHARPHGDTRHVEFRVDFPYGVPQHFTCECRDLSVLSDFIGQVLEYYEKCDKSGRSIHDMEPRRRVAG